MIRDEVKKLSGYTAPAQEAAVKLNQNESPVDLPEELKTEIVKSLSRSAWNRYPSSDAAELRQLLAEYTGWDPAGVIVGNGSNELIQWTVTAAVEAGASVIIAAPSFSLYRTQAVLRGATPILVSCMIERLDLDVLLSAIEQHNPAAVFVCSPNNPTGIRVSNEHLLEICQAAPGLVIADEAYRHFCDQDYAQLGPIENLVLLRTFSKVFGLAALRVGYLLAHPTVTQHIDKVRLPYNLDLLSMAAGAVVIRHYAHFQKQAAKLRESRDQLAESLSKSAGLRVHGGASANFVLLELQEAKPGALVDELLKDDILVRDVSSYAGLERCVRITAGTEDENRALLAALPDALARAQEES